MKIRMLNEHVLAGPDVVRHDDGSVELPDGQGAAVVRAGMAETSDPMPDEPEPETETADDPESGETAALKSKRRRG